MGSQSPYQRTLVKTLAATGWHHSHTRAVFDRQARVWITPAAKGYPDLTAIHPGSGALLFAELKGDCPAPRRGWSVSDVRPEQLGWLRWLHRNPAAAAVVLRPTDDWNMVADWLQAPHKLLSGYGWLPPDDHRPIRL